MPGESRRVVNIATHSGPHLPIPRYSYGNCLQFPRDLRFVSLPKPSVLV